MVVKIISAGKLECDEGAGNMTKVSNRSE